jgi:hypothetical protein
VKPEKFVERIKRDQLMPLAAATLKDGSVIMLLASKAGETMDSPEDKSVAVHAMKDKVCVIGEMEAITLAAPPRSSHEGSSL